MTPRENRDQAGKSTGMQDENAFRFEPIRPSQERGTPPCIENCPSGGNIREWIGVVAQRQKIGLTREQAYRRAWEIIVDRNPFPAVMGRVCPHPCESDCNRAEKDGAVSVNELERFLGDWAIDQGWTLPRVENDAKSERIAVIGAGPAGLSFAYQMARRGYRVTVFDRHELPGGMLRYGIPDYRLPPAVLDAEIRRITDLGVEIRTVSSVGGQVELDAVSRDHDIVFVGIGAQTGRRLNIPGEDGPGVLGGIDFLARVNRGETVEIGSRVIVVGGGNTAVDAARAARRTGATVTMLYRRTIEEMPAIRHEIDEADEEGVKIEFLTAPMEVLRAADGCVTAVTVQRMELGEPDSSGRRSPVPIPGDTFEMSASAVITAVSQEPDWVDLEEVSLGTTWLKTASDGLLGLKTYAGGDVRGLGTASLAIGQGRVAADTAHARLQGRTAYPGNGLVRNERARPNLKLDLYASADRVTPPRHAPEERLTDPAMPVSETISEAAFLAEAERCLSCESCFGCQHCITYCNGGGFIPLSEQAPGRYFALDLSVCEGCGKCIDVCPCGFLHKADRN